MAKVWFVSDEHYGHFNTLRYCGRPFFTSTACDQAMVDRHNAIVKENDIVIHLGDFAMHSSSVKRILPRLKGTHWLCLGNHDLPFHYFLKTRGQKFIDKMMKEYTDAGFVRIFPSGAEHVFKAEDGRSHTVRLCHFPTRDYKDNTHGLKHWDSRPVDNGTLNISGHVHQAYTKKGNNVNVGVDVHDFRPISLEEVLYIWQDSRHYIPAPSRWRIAIWKAYHTAIWKVTGLFKKSPPKKPQKMVG